MKSLKSSIKKKYEIKAGPVIDMQTRRPLDKNELTKRASQVKTGTPFTDALAKEGAAVVTVDDDVFDLQALISVDAWKMSKDEYEKMEDDIRDAEITTSNYHVYAWNDSSGYEYWSDEKNDSNYIQISVKVKNLKKTDPKKLARDLLSLYSRLEHWGDD